MEDLIIKEREFKEKIVEVINTSNLPAFIIKPTLKELLGQVELLEQEQYNRALKTKEETKEKKKK